MKWYALFLWVERGEGGRGADSIDDPLSRSGDGSTVCLNERIISAAHTTQIIPSIRVARERKGMAGWQ
jgi:hypothetical protein